LPICRVLAGAGAKIAPSIFYAAATRQPSTRAVRDHDVSAQIRRVHTENYAASTASARSDAVASLGVV
jgi:putative transposase